MSFAWGVALGFPAGVLWLALALAVGRVCGMNQLEDDE